VSAPAARRVRVRVPATSANLGPGFDCLGLAVGRYDEVDVELCAGGLTVDVYGEGADELPRDQTHLVVSSLHRTAERLGVRLPGLRLRAHNTIPHGRGLGSSAAAVCAGVLAARALVPDGDARLPDADLLDLAAGIEGHPDNVAACLLGGLTLAWADPDAGFRAVRLEPHESLRPVLFVPPSRLATVTARGLLPATVAHADAAANAGRAALLTHALTGDPGLLLPATEDRLHQAYRAPAMPASAELVTRLRADGVPAVVSGAGPSVLALPGPLAPPGESMREYLPAGWALFVLPVDRTGAVVRPG